MRKLLRLLAYMEMAGDGSQHVSVSSSICDPGLRASDLSTLFQAQTCVVLPHRPVYAERTGQHFTIGYFPTKDHSNSVVSVFPSSQIVPRPIVTRKSSRQLSSWSRQRAQVIIRKLSHNIKHRSVIAPSHIPLHCLAYTPISS